VAHGASSQAGLTKPAYAGRLPRTLGSTMRRRCGFSRKCAFRRERNSHKRGQAASRGHAAKRRQSYQSAAAPDISRPGHTELTHLMFASFSKVMGGCASRATVSCSQPPQSVCRPAAGGFSVATLVVSTGNHQVSVSAVRAAACFGTGEHGILAAYTHLLSFAQCCLTPRSSRPATAGSVSPV
jgi:hypothetical protein